MVVISTEELVRRTVILPLRVRVRVGVRVGVRVTRRARIEALMTLAL